MANSLIEKAHRKGITLMEVEGSDEVRFPCPVCPLDKSRKFKLYFNTRKNRGLCHICQTKFSLGYLLESFGLDPVKEDKSVSRVAEVLKGLSSLQNLVDSKKLNVKLPERTRLSDVKSLKGRKYLRGRQVSKASYLLFGLYVCLDEFDVFYGRIIIPIKNSDGVTMSFVGRDFTGDLKPKYRFPKGINVFNYLYRQDFIRGQEIAVLFEGTFSVLRTYLLFKKEFNDRVIPLASFSKHFSIAQENVLKSKGINKVVVFYDGDAESESIKVCKRINSWGRAEYIKMDFDIQPDDFTAEELAVMVSSALGVLQESRITRVAREISKIR